MIDDESGNARKYSETSEEALSQGEGGAIRCRRAVPAVSLMIRCLVNLGFYGCAVFTLARRVP